MTMTSPFGINLRETLDRLHRRRESSRVVSIRERIVMSFEFFPPKDDEGARRLEDTIDRLAALGPEFFSMTYGAGGSSRDRSLAAVTGMLERGQVPVAAHLTCVGSSAAEIDEAIDAFAARGVRHFVALRGDLPAGADHQLLDGGAYRRADQLVAAIRCRGDFEISVATYPEKHPESRDLDQDIDALKAKQDAGATRAITQFFFDSDNFLRFRDLAVRAGIRIPIVPGILPIVSFAGTRRFADTCGAVIPHWMHELFSTLDDAPEVRDMVATTVATEQCARLIEHGVEHFHFYTLNRPELTSAICHILGLGRGTVGAASSEGNFKLA